MIPSACTDLPFDGSILGAPVWRLDDPTEAGEAVDAAKSTGVGLISYRGASGAAEIIEPLGFRNVETLVTFEGPLPTDPSPSCVRSATSEDADTVSEIAAQSFTTDRWHADPLIPDEKAAAFKAAWARNNVLGRAEAVLLSEDESGMVTGFNAVLLRDGVAVIDLIAVAPGCQGRGFGHSLIQGMAAAFPGIEIVRVGTQASNEASQRLYASFGWAETHRADTWHWVG